MLDLDRQVLLLGGSGFLGKGLQRELSRQHIVYKVLDINDVDLTKLQTDTVEFNQFCEQLTQATNVVLLAAILGIDTFNDITNATKAADINEKICSNIIAAIDKTSNKKLDLTYYTTSEVFGSLSSKDIFIDNDTPYRQIEDQARQKYAYQKISSEYEFKNQVFYNKLANFKTIRPFNVYGLGQRRGVVYSMIMSALLNNTISFADDTTRTFTDIDLCSKQSVDIILSEKSLHKNVADPRCSITLECLAHIIDEVLYDTKLITSHCKLIKKEPDKYVRYRQVSKVNNDVNYTKTVMAPHIIKLAREIYLNNFYVK